MCLWNCWEVDSLLLFVIACCCFRCSLPLLRHYAYLSPTRGHVIFDFICVKEIWRNHSKLIYSSIYLLIYQHAIKSEQLFVAKLTARAGDSISLSTHIMKNVEISGLIIKRPGTNKSFSSYSYMRICRKLWGTAVANSTGTALPTWWY